MKHILIVEDDVNISNMLCDLLIQNGYEPTAAYSGTEAVLNFKHNTYELILLDLMLPGKMGDLVLSEIRAVSNVPIIAVTAKDDKKTTVAILKAGADDYISKPFDNKELIARIDVQLRRGLFATVASDTLKFKDIVLNFDGYDATIQDKPVLLSKREFEILKLMMSNPQKVFSKNNLYESVWHDEFLGDDNTINVHISRIRSKLAKLNPDREYIQTVWGIGFKMQD